MTEDELCGYLERQGSPVTQAAIDQLESDAEVEMPPAFLSFLKRCNGGVVRDYNEQNGALFPRFSNDLCLRNPGYNHFVDGDEYQRKSEFCKSMHIQSFYPLIEHPKEYGVMSFQRYLAEIGCDTRNVPKNMILFGDQGWGHLFVLDLEKPGGEVIWFDHEQFPTSEYPEFPSYDGSFRLEMTFEQFVQALEPFPSSSIEGELEASMGEVMTTLKDIVSSSFSFSIFRRK